MMPADGLEQIKGHDAIFFGAVGFPNVPDHVSLWGLLIPMRRGFQQYVNLRPGAADAGDHVAARRPRRRATSTSGSCARTPRASTRRSAGGCSKGPRTSSCIQESVFTRRGTDRILRYAFELARSRAEEAPDVGDEVERDRDHDAVLGRALQGDVAADYPDVKHRPVPHRHPGGALRAASRTGSTWSSARICSATSSPTSAPRRRARSGSRRRATSTRSASFRRCSSRCTARRPTSRASTSRTRSDRSGRAR